MCLSHVVRGTAEPPPRTAPREGHLLSFSPSLPLFRLFLSFPLSHPLGGSHRADIQHIITRWLKMHHSSQSLSLSLLCTAHDLLRGGTVCTPCVCVWLCVCVCACSSLSLPCLLRHKHPLIKAVISLPSDGTLAHVKEVGAGGRGISGAPGSFSEKTCARVYLRACARVSSACNQQLRSEHQRLSVGVFWCRAMTTALCLHRGDSLRYEKI